MKTFALFLSLVLLYQLGWSNNTNPIPTKTIGNTPPPDAIDRKAIEHELQEAFAALNVHPPPVGVDTIPVDNLSDGSIGGLLDEEIELVQTAQAVLSEIKSKALFIDSLDGQNLATLPQGISQTIGNVEYTLGINKIKLFPTYAQLEVFMEIDAPKLESPLMFYAPDIKFSNNGGIVGGASLGLLGDMPVNIIPEKSVMILRRGQADAEGSFTSGTFVTIDCEGFKTLSIDAEVLFSREWIKPVNDTGDNRVQGEFSLRVESWEDILIDLDLGDFVVTGLEDIKWRIAKAVFDFSETQNSDYLHFPVNGYTPVIADQRWTGFYLESLQVELPEKLTSYDEPILFEANDVVIDDAGFTGDAGLTPVISINKGNLDGWAFSIDSFYVSLIANHFEEVRFNGNINVPMFSSGPVEDDITEADCFRYRAFINPGNVYNFTVTNDDSYEVNMWKATATIEDNSTLDLLYENDAFTVTATLYGSLDIDGEFGTGLEINVPSMSFEGLELSNRGTYFRPGYWQLPDNIGAQIGSFGILIDSLHLTEGEADENNLAEANISMAMAVTLDGQLSVDARGGFSIKGELLQNGEHQKWRLKGFQVNDISIDASFSGMNRVHGVLNFYDEHPNYGTGFRGAVEAEFRGIDTEISAVGQFGSKDGDRYFLIDALAEFGTGIPLGGLSLKGFGGGVYRHMSREDDVDKAFSQLIGGDITILGAGLSGIVYNVDFETVIGLKATVILSTTDGNAFNATVSFGMEFGRTEDTGGINLNRIWFQGVGQFMTPVNLDQVPSFPAGVDSALDLSSGLDNNPFSGGPSSDVINADFRAYALIDLNFAENIYNSRLQITVQAGDFLTGNAWAASYMNLNNGQWWLFIGAPEPVDQRNTISLKIANLLSANIRSYFAAGNHNIPDVPDPYLPGFEDVFSQLTAYNGARPNNAFLNTGKGLVFGASFDFSVGTEDDPLRFLFFRGYFNGGFGFDFGLQQRSGECANSIGIDGWYATGQAWAGFQARVWARIKLFFIEKDLEVFYAKVAAGVRMELPNPFWSKAIVHHELRVLGIIDIEGNFTFELGERWTDIVPEECAIEQGNPIAELEIIEEVEVAGGLTESVPVESAISVYMAIPNEQLMTFYEENGTSERYRIKLSQVGLFHQNGDQITVGAPHPDSGFDEENTHYTLQYINFLPANTLITAKAVAKFQRLVSGDVLSSGTILNAVWEDVLDEEGNSLKEEKSVTFTTGEQPDHIVPENIMGSYPVAGQHFFLRDQYADGYYLDLFANQLYLFEDLPAGYEAKGRLKNNIGEVVDILTLSYGTFNLDNSIFTDSTVHGTFITIAKSDEIQLDSDYTLEVAVLHQGGPPVDPEYGEEQILHSWNFHTSQFSTLEEKLQAFTPTHSNYQNGGNEFAENDVLTVRYNVPEGFDNFEISGGDTFRPMLGKEVLITEPNGECSNDLNDWYCSEAGLMAYYGYPAIPDCSVPFELTPPIEAVEIRQQNTNSTILELDYNFAKEVFDHYELVYASLSIFLDCINPFPLDDDPGTSSGPYVLPLTLDPGDGECSPEWAQTHFCTTNPAANLPGDLSEYGQANDGFYIQFKYQLPRRISLNPNSGNEILHLY